MKSLSMKGLTFRQMMNVRSETIKTIIRTESKRIAVMTVAWYVWLMVLTTFKLRSTS